MIYLAEKHRQTVGLNTSYHFGSVLGIGLAASDLDMYQHFDGELVYLEEDTPLEEIYYRAEIDRKNDSRAKMRVTVKLTDAFKRKINLCELLLSGVPSFLRGKNFC